MRLRIALWLMVAGVAMGQQAAVTSAGGTGNVTAQAKTEGEAAASSLAAKTLQSEIESNPEYQRQRQQFEAALRNIESDASFRAQRERMTKDQVQWEHNPEMQLQKAKLNADVRAIEAGIAWQLKVKSFQNNLEKARRQPNSK